MLILSTVVNTAMDVSIWSIDAFSVISDVLCEFTSHAELLFSADIGCTSQVYAMHIYGWDIPILGYRERAPSTRGEVRECDWSPWITMYLGSARATAAIHVP